MTDEQTEAEGFLTRAIRAREDATKLPPGVEYVIFGTREIEVGTTDRVYTLPRERYLDVIRMALATS